MRNSTLMAVFLLLGLLCWAGLVYLMHSTYPDARAQFVFLAIWAGAMVLTAAPLSSTALDSVAQAVTGSFRILTQAEKAALKPLRVRVRTVRPGETVATLANEMRGVGRKLELFRLINALPASAILSAGDKVKIITDR